MGKAVASGIFHHVSRPDGEGIGHHALGVAGDGVRHDDLIAGDRRVLVEALHGGERHIHAAVPGVGPFRGEIRLPGHHAADEEVFPVDGHRHPHQVGAAVEAPRDLLVQDHQIVHQVLAVDVRAAPQRQGVKVEEVSPHAHGLHRGAAALGADADGLDAVVGVQVQPAALGGLQGLLHHPALQGPAEGEDVLLRLAVVHRQIAGHVGEAGLRPSPEPLGGGEGGQRAADHVHPHGAPNGRQDQHDVEDQQEPLLESEAPDRRQHPPGQLSQVPHDGFSTIRTWLPASRGLLEVVIT